jgi:hypothetical protein
MSEHGDEAEVNAAPKLDLYSLDPEKFPMLYAFNELTMRLSNSAQSAPGCTSKFKEIRWQEMESRMAGMSAKQFVEMALCRDNDQHMDRFFPGWRADWE